MQKLQGDSPGARSSRPDRLERDAAARISFTKRLRIFLPLGAGLGLIGVFGYLLWQQAGSAPEPVSIPPVAEAPKPPASAPPENRPANPDSPLAYDPPRPAPGEGLARWDLDRLPDGWDPQLAAKIADYFDEMDISNLAQADLERVKNLQQIRENFEQFLKGLGPEAIPTLDKILNSETDFINRRFLLGAIGDLGQRSEEATFSLLDFYHHIREDQRARSETNYVIEAMGRLKNQTSYQSISDLVDDPVTSSYDRNKLIQALGEHPRREESIPRFVAHGRDDDDVGTRNHSWQAIGKMRSKGAPALSDLISSFEREQVWYVKQTMLGTIGYLGDPSALPFLERVARTNDDSRVRLSAFNAIRLLGTPQAMKVLRSAVAGERDETVRQNVQGWLEL